jgi:hypothetical protein
MVYLLGGAEVVFARGMLSMGVRFSRTTPHRSFYETVTNPNVGSLAGGSRRMCRTGILRKKSSAQSIGRTASAARLRTTRSMRSIRHDRGDRMFLSLRSQGGHVCQMADYKDQPER